MQRHHHNRASYRHYLKTEIQGVILDFLEASFKITVECLKMKWSFWVLDTVVFVNPSLTALRVCVCFKAVWSLIYKFLNLLFFILFLNFQLRLVGTALGIFLILGKQLHLHDRPWIIFFKLRFVTALHKGMQLESCFMITAREHLTVSPESRCIGAAGTNNN